MALRAIWKGYLKLGSISCGIKLINAASESEKIHFRILNRKDRLPVKSTYVDEITGDVVETEDQMKGYQLENGDYLLIEPEEVKKLRQITEHTLEVDETVPLSSIDQRYLDKPYYVVPADTMSQGALCGDSRGAGKKGCGGPRQHRALPARPRGRHPAAWRHWADDDDAAQRQRGGFGKEHL